MNTCLQHAPPPIGGFLQCELLASAITPLASIIGVRLNRLAMLSISGGGWLLHFWVGGASEVELELASAFLALFTAVAPAMPADCHTSFNQP